MDLKDQLKKLFPEHVESIAPEEIISEEKNLWLQDTPILCKYEKRKGKAITILEGYSGSKSDFKKLTKELKQTLNVGGSFKDDKIFIQGDYREQIMQILKTKGFTIKRVGG